ncbi:unnamed protein product (macronuclear) [Paramecium tetraurelia]|uniref:Dynein regulatory complex subunit 7 n=1 Tax=Paramecium tetraurelia TaxID=5888 RepID=A0D6H5_PARTE|nr:uncharacterized protein GSPATT00001683001 [Paramecium tetraurelia]CAK78642.1 unnamed protein product [Paramecium tetraurelia]|eukprot:XP_001446039.1 hypothetical protein (macronuclear) [Paramecium tetraurelia strain d4-2]
MTSSAVSDFEIQKQAQQQQNNILAILKSGNATVVNEKLQRCKDFKDGKDITIPFCYKENSPKEELVLEHVQQFQKQFQLHYDERRNLFLYPKNECDLYKFICTTIRPQKIGYLELYNYEQCARYMSFFIAYEQLDPPDQFPKVIPSPTNVARWQKGDCFDLSILLCSVLIGVGYDAYCVYGTAPRSITSKNESDLDYIFINNGIKEDDEDQNKDNDELKDNEFAILPKEEIISKYDTKIQKQKEEYEKEQRRIALTIDDDEPDQMGHDFYAGRRIHCWILLKAGKRGVERNLFIEPSTGRIYPINDSPFLTVDAVFNNRNFWINMKLESKVADLNFDEMDTSMNWEYVMLDTLVEQAQQDDEDYNYGEDHNQQQKHVDPQQQQLQDIVQILDMPPPWPPKVFIDKECFLKGTPLGESTVFYKKCKIDSFAPYSQEQDGLVQRFTIYQDYKRLKIQEIRYFYKHRSDKLVLKRRFPYEFKTIEEYEPGNKPQRKTITTIDRQLRIIIYYPTRNHDGLIKRIEKIGEKTIEEYENRDDRVIYRSVRFDPKDKKFEQRDLTHNDRYMGQVKITKMTQKYELSELYPASEQPQKVVIDLQKNLIKVYYHMNKGEINPQFKELKRENMHSLGKLTEPGVEKKNEDALVSQENQRIANLEKECLTHIKNQEDEVKKDEEQLRSQDLKLEKTLHDKARERYKETLKKSEEEKQREQADKDYLYPYLEKRKLQGKDVLSYNEALEIQKDVMTKLKERLLSRAAIIQKKLEEERAKLDQAEQMQQKKSDPDDNEYINIQFRIDILEQRAIRFESQALIKYEEMDRKLKEDKRLSELKKK